MDYTQRLSSVRGKYYKRLTVVRNLVAQHDEAARAYFDIAIIYQPRWDPYPSAWEEDIPMPKMPLIPTLSEVDIKASTTLNETCIQFEMFGL